MATSRAEESSTGYQRDLPLVTVVIATHDRVDHLRLTLDALALQTLPAIEVIVVDDDSPPGTAELAAERAVRYLRVPRGGPGHARQAGWQAASAEVIAFTDDDCIPTSGWAEALTRPIRDGRADLVQGRTLPRPDQVATLGPWSRTQHIESEGGTYPTCNMAYRRTVLETLGGFRPSFAGPRTSGEDTELAWRAIEAGYRSEFVPEALVHHEVWPSQFLPFLRDRLRWGMVVQIIRYHPESRRMAYHRYFYRPSHARTLVGLLALVAAGAIRWWLPLVMLAVVVVAYIARSHGSERSVPSRVALLLQTMVADAFEVVVFIWSSIRYRTLLL